MNFNKREMIYWPVFQEEYVRATRQAAQPNYGAPGGVQPRCGAAANTPVQVAGAGAGQEAAPGLGAALELPARAAASL